MTQSDVFAKSITDTNAADDDRLVTAAQPDTSATMANTTHAGGAARNVTVTTAGTGDNAKTCTCFLDSIPVSCDRFVDHLVWGIRFHAIQRFGCCLGSTCRRYRGY